MSSVFDADGLEVTPEQTQQALAEGAQLVDVREGYEWEAGRVAGADHIELERLASNATRIAKDRPVIFQCRLGARSAMAAKAFRTSGYDAYSMAGGLLRWSEEGRPLEPEDGVVADH